MRSWLTRYTPGYQSGSGEYLARSHKTIGCVGLPRFIIQLYKNPLAELSFHWSHITPLNITEARCWQVGTPELSLLGTVPTAQSLTISKTEAICSDILLWLRAVCTTLTATHLKEIVVRAGVLERRVSGLETQSPRVENAFTGVNSITAIFRVINAKTLRMNCTAQVQQNDHKGWRERHLHMELYDITMNM